jgi:hypothetical protein
MIVSDPDRGPTLHLDRIVILAKFLQAIPSGVQVARFNVHNSFLIPSDLQSTLILQFVIKYVIRVVNLRFIKHE